MRELRSDKCKEYLTFLIKKDLIFISMDETDGLYIYSTSPKGKDALNQFLELISTYYK